MVEDIFSREEVAKRMCAIICQGGVSPIVFNGPWGCGKTTHALRMESCINSDYSSSHKCVYWNAAKSDFAQEPLPAFVAALSKYVSDEEKENFEKSGYELCRDVMGAALFQFSSQLCKTITKIDLAKIVVEIKKAVEEIDPEEVQKRCFSELIRGAREDEGRMKTAQNLIKAISQGKHVVILIDELDRCRPDFALKMIELIKHLFCEAKCSFVLVMNKISMCSSISHLYGLENTEAQKYLNKFFQLELRLPSVDTKGKGETCSYLYLSHLLAKDERLKMEMNPLIKEFIETIVRHKGLQLREIERIADTMNLLYTMRKAKFGAQKNHYISLLICVVAYLVSLDHDLCRLLNERAITAEATLEHLGFNLSDPPGKMAIHSLCYEYLQIITKLTLASDDSEWEKVANSFISQHKQMNIISLNEQFHYFISWLNYSTFVE